MENDFKGLSAKPANMVCKGNCTRCGGLIDVKYRSDQVCGGFLVHRSPAECLRQVVEGGTHVVYDVREEPAGEVAGCVMSLEKVRRRYPK